MADYERRQGGGSGGSSGGYNPRKRRYRDDDENDRDDRDRNRGGPRRRYEAPPHVRIRKSLLVIAENPMRPWHDEVVAIANLLTDTWDGDELLPENFVALVLQLAIEQPLKTPFLAAVLLVANVTKHAVVELLLKKLVESLEAQIVVGEWRDVKLFLKLLACLQGCLAGEGVFPLLGALFEKATELQTSSEEDTIGTELVKIILLTIPYVMVAAPGRSQENVADLMGKTEVIASEPHPLQPLIEPYDVEKGEDQAPSQSIVQLLQSQLQNEANNGWILKFLPRPWELPEDKAEMRMKLDEVEKHVLPPVKMPTTLIAGPRLLFPEVYFSVYSSQDVESVPPITDAASCLIRDALSDTINILHYNRNVTARHLIEVDCYFTPKTLAPRATPFDRLREIEAPKSTWKPEDVAVDAVFSQLFLLPTPEHKLVYYHAVLTEACKLAPAAIAPSLGRAIRFLYRNIHRLDLELVNRFIDWFSHHLSNFGFTWKWAEWVDDVYLPDLHPSKALIMGSIEKEIRLSFAQRIKNTLPEPYRQLIGPDKEKDVPDFKFVDDKTPFAAEGCEIAALLKRKAPDEEMEPVIERIHALALDTGLDPLVASTDVFVTAVLHVGAKTLSHVLAAIERTKDRLTDAGAASDAARAQILSAVMAYWAAHPGVALTIVEKLLNYSILTPQTVIQWALVAHAGATRGRALARAHVYEMVFNTIVKVTSRVRQMRDDDDEVKSMHALFAVILDALSAWATGAKDEMMEDGAEEERDAMVRRWGERWLRVFRRRAAIEEAYLLEAARVEEEQGGETVDDGMEGHADGEGGEHMDVAEVH